MDYKKATLKMIVESIEAIKIINIEHNLCDMVIYTDGFGASSSYCNASFSDFVARLLSSLDCNDYELSFEYDDDDSERYVYKKINHDVAVLFKNLLKNNGLKQ